MRLSVRRDPVLPLILDASDNLSAIITAIGKLWFILSSMSNTRFIYLGKHIILDIFH